MLFYVMVQGTQATLYSATHVYTCATVRLFNMLKANHISRIKGEYVESWCATGQFTITLTMPMFFRLMGVS